MSSLIRIESITMDSHLKMYLYIFQGRTPCHPKVHKCIYEHSSLSSDAGMADKKGPRTMTLFIEHVKANTQTCKHRDPRTRVPTCNFIFIARLRMANIDRTSCVVLNV